ncbi:MAG: hypothetical protein NTV52_27325 [Acidobacteria bacterium]|nr:hypothetical protein [Acidobacteriota bacterium]
MGVLIGRRRLLFPNVFDIVDVEGVGETSVGIGVETLRGVDFDGDGLRIPVVPHAPNVNERMRLAFIVEGVGHGPGEAAGGGYIGKRTGGGQFGPIEIRGHDEIGLRRGDDGSHSSGGCEDRATIRRSE